MKDREEIQKTGWYTSDVLIAFFLMAISLGVVLPLFRYAQAVPLELRLELILIIMLTVGVVYLNKRYPISFYVNVIRMDSRKEILLYGIAGGLLLAAVNFPYRVFLGEREIIGNLKFMSLPANRIFVVLYLISLMVIIPIMEELFFRGFVYRILKNRYDKVLSAIVTCSIYAAGHLDIRHGFYSLILIYVYEKSNCLCSPIMAHILWNGIVGITIYLLKSSS